MKSVNFFKWVITGVMFIIAVLLAYALWSHYMYSPWTRDGRIRVEVTKVSPDISGLVTAVNVEDNQYVHRGDVLMVIDQQRYGLALDNANTQLAHAVANYNEDVSAVNVARATVQARYSSFQMYQDRADRRARLSALAISKEDLADAQSTAETAESEWHQAQAALQQQQNVLAVAQVVINQAKVAVSQAELNLKRTVIRAPADGYMTNVTVRVGDYANAGAQQMALVDSDSYYIYGYFEETKLPNLQIGDRADIRLLSGGRALHGTVTGIARAIADTENTNSNNQLLNVNPTFDWVRLAQRVPVRIAIDTRHMPKGTLLVAGMTATVILHPGSAKSDDNAPDVSTVSHSADH